MEEHRSGQRMSKNGRWGSGPSQIGGRQQKNFADNDGVSKGAADGAKLSSTRSFSTVAAGNSSNGAGVGGNGGSFAGALGRQQGHNATVPVSHRLIEGEAPEQVDAMHRRLLYLFSHVVGLPVKIVTKTSDVYVGIMDSINPNDAQSVVLRYAYNRTGSRAAHPIDTLVINGDDCLCISSIVSFDEGDSREGLRSGFKTDTDITRTGVSGKGGERELHRWVPDESEAPETLDSHLGHASEQGLSWDQFATNEKLFGLTTDFDEEIYTTKLDRTKPGFKEREREAIRIAQEIQNAPLLNSHVAEERTEVAAGDSGALDEEDKYGAVLRSSGVAGKYVPPYLRGKLDAPQVTRQSTASSLQSTDAGASTTASTSLVDAVAKHASSEGALAATVPNSSGAMAALAKLNIRTSGHRSVQNTKSQSAAEPAPGSLTSSIVAPPSPSTAAESTATAVAKQPNVPATSKLANLRGLKHRSDVAALNKPMADITEKLNSERERIHQHKQALLKNRMSELVKFHKSFKLSTPMPEDVAEIVGVRNKPHSQDTEADTPTDFTKTLAEQVSDRKSGGLSEVMTDPKSNLESTAVDEHGHLAAHTAKPSNVTTTKESVKLSAEAISVESSSGVDGNTESKEMVGSKHAKEKEKEQRGTKVEDKKTAFKFNTKASSFKPSASATPFVPKFSASTSRASSAAGGSEFNPFFGRRVLKRSAMSLWGDAFELGEDSEKDGSSTPTWPFGQRTYRSQFAPEEPEVMMYSSSQGGYMHQYGYGYYNPYQYPPPQMAMLAPGVGTQMQTAGYVSGGSVYGNGPYNTVPGYPSPIIAASGRSPVITAMNGPPPPTVHPLPHVQGSGGSGTGTVNPPHVSTPDLPMEMPMGQAHQAHQHQQYQHQHQHQHQNQQSSTSGHAGRSRSDSPNVMYGASHVAPVHIGMVPPHMPFNGMQSNGYMAPMASVSHQGYPQQSIPMPMPMGYTQYPPAQVYGASPPGMAMMHGSPHPDQGPPPPLPPPGNHHHPGYQG
ncbi:poly(A)-binding protein binding protein [Coemansia sp. RSA 1939]|nr:poly(A)-binding protein binding protein [Coemansia sp. RSA 1939]KAJ2610939.1 poly(A)-binding protein binding protein [Coemansia sp. RSA 1804]